MTADDLSLIPLFVGVAAMLVTVMLSNRRTGEARRRMFALGAIVSLSAIFVGILVLWIPKIFIAGEIAWIVPAALATVLVVMSFFSAVRALKPRPETAATQFAESRRYGLFIVAVSFSFAVLVLYAIGFFLGSFVDQVLGGNLRVVLAFVGVGVGLAAFVPVAVFKVRAARRRARIRDGHPASDEVAEHAMRRAEEKELRALDDVFTSPLPRVLAYAVSFVAIMLVPPVMNYIINAIPEAPAEPADLSVVYVAAAVLGLAVASVAVIDFFARPSILDAQHEYELAALSDEERLRIQSRREGASRHRFPGRLADPHRSIRVLTLTTDGDVRLERVATSTLLQAQSGDITSDEDEQEIFDDEDFDDMPPKLVDAGVRMADRLGRADFAQLGLAGFDAFEARGGESVYVVARVDDDYADFPEELGAEITGSDPS